MSILFQQDGLIFSILRKDFKKVIVLCEYLSTSNRASLFSFRERIVGNFATVNLAFAGEKVTLVPQSLFSIDDAKALAHFQFELAADEELMIDELKHHGLVVLYAINKEWLSVIQKYFDNVKTKHAGSFVIEYYMNRYKNKPGEHIFANIWHQKVEIVVIKNGKLQLYNIFDYQTDEDLLYAILNVYEQIPLSPETIPLKVSGKLKRNTHVWQLLETYIRYVEPENRPDEYQYSHEFKAIEAHQYNRIFQISTCEL